MNAPADWPEIEIASPRPAPPLAGPLLLGLFMLMLAIFIILVSFSTVAEQKARAVVLAMTETFRTTASFTIVRPAEEEAAPGTGNFPELGRLVQRGIAGSRFEAPPSASRLRLGISTAALFGRGRATRLLPSASALLGDISRTLVAAPEGERYDVEYLVGRGRDSDIELSTARAAAVAEALVAAGTPRSGVTVGLIAAAVDQSSIVFSVRAADAGGPVR